MKFCRASVGLLYQCNKMTISEIQTFTLVCVVLSQSIVLVMLSSTPEKPNLILILADDLGFGDLSVYGHPSQEWGPVDEMAKEGIRFTNWYAPDSMCTPSRAAMMTGRLPFRSGIMMGEDKGRIARVFLTTSSTGLPHSEITIAEALRDAGYKTGMVGKWHLGINQFNSTDGQYLPDKQGFDFAGTFLPLTLTQKCDESKKHKHIPNPYRNICFVYRNRTIVQQPIDHSTLTDNFVSDAQQFIYDNRKNPFFFYFSLAQVHTPLFNNPRFANSSRRGSFGSNINEMSYAVGEILQTLRDLKLEENTLVLFASDHGPAINYCTEGGIAGPFRGAKIDYLEGGLRIPVIAWWPGKLQPRTDHSLGSLMDIFPTFIDFANGGIPTDRVIDGKSQKGVFLQKKKSPHETLFFYCDETLTAVRHQSYKIYFYTAHKDYSNETFILNHCQNGISDLVDLAPPCADKRIKEDPPLIYNVDIDPGEKYSLTGEKYEELLKEVTEIVRVHQKTMPKKMKYLLHSEYRHWSLSPCCNPPYCFCNYPSK